MLERVRFTTARPSGGIGHLLAPAGGASLFRLDRHHRPVKLALHRSLTFWLGLLALASLGLAWWHSMDFQSGFAFVAGGRPTGIFAGGAAVVLCLVDGSTSAGGWRFEEFYRYSIEAEKENWFPAPSYTVSDPVEVRWVALPFWTICGFSLGAWAALLLWRARRRKRAAFMAERLHASASGSSTATRASRTMDDEDED